MDLTGQKPEWAIGSAGDGDLTELLEKAWALRQANFPPEIEMNHPHKTTVISVTGQKCSLNCAHCGHHYLEGMMNIEEGRRWHQEKENASFLISGGSTKEGKVPFYQYLEEIRRLKGLGRLNLHVGLVDDYEAKLLGDLADTVSFDFVVDDQSIREVFGLNRSGEDYLRSYQLLRKYTRVTPHILVGLHQGRIAGEYRALAALREVGAQTLVFIVFRPTPGTRYALVAPPPPEEVASLLATARIMFPATPVILGCLRPGGSYRLKLDGLALRAGVNKIVNPAPELADLARTMGLTVIGGDECCVL
ncbi:MAG: radical SAM protein [Firmicutes bacterium]|nr:radical SAM protein [Bacillota bacterium]MCL5039750.1 radical SAM protein [Bacillota bacterium]